MNATGELPNPFVIEVDHHTVTLQQKNDQGGTLYRWQRNDGVWMSPEFTDGKEAIDYPKTHSFRPQ